MQSTRSQLNATKCRLAVLVLVFNPFRPQFQLPLSAQFLPPPACHGRHLMRKATTVSGPLAHISSSTAPASFGVACEFNLCIIAVATAIQMWCSHKMSISNSNQHSVGMFSAAFVCFLFTLTNFYESASL